jgi:hypothetical protein
VLTDVLVERRDVEPALGEHAAGDVRHRYDRGALLVQLGRRDAADVAEALNGAAEPGELPAEPPA